MSNSHGWPEIGQSVYLRGVLIDTGALLAIADSRDINHSSATECLDLMTSHRLHVYVSTATIIETHRRFMFDLGRDRARRFLDIIFDGSINIVELDKNDLGYVVEFLDRYHWINLVLTDAINMSIMKRIGIPVCFSFDDHYLQTGLIKIPPFHLQEQ